MKDNVKEFCEDHRELNAEIIGLLREIRDINSKNTEHNEEHEFLRELIERERAAKELRQAIKTRIIGTGILTGLGVLAAGLLLVIKDWLGL